MRQLQAVSDGRSVFKTAKANGNIVLGRSGFLANLKGPDIAVQTRILVLESKGHHRTRDKKEGASDCAKVKAETMGKCTAWRRQVKTAQHH